MIVVDTDVIATFWLRTPRTEFAVRARRKDPIWIAPVLWRSEFRSVLRKYLVAGLFTVVDAIWLAEQAEADMRGREFGVASASVLDLVAASGHSSYDCEFVALAADQGLRLVTGDRRLAQVFPEVAVWLEVFASDA